MSEKPRRRIRLWAVLVLTFTTLLFLTTVSIILTYRLALKARYEAELHRQLTAGLERLAAADFDPEAAEELSENGVRILLVDAAECRVRYQSDDGPLLPWQRKEEEGGTGSEPRLEDADSLAEVVAETLGGTDGSFFFTDTGPEGENTQSLRNKALLLCGREKGVLFCLLLPVESTNAAITLAIRYASIVNITAWCVTLFLAYALSQVITRRHRRFRLVAARVANLDFSQRCPPAITAETDELGQIINSMADTLKENITALQEANEQLQVELAERIRQQQITADLIANLSHDLKTPIAIISGYAEGLQEGVARTPEKQQTYYEMILRESERMQDIVSRILALGRMESGETPIRIEDFDLIRLLNELRESFQRELERLGLTLEGPDWPDTCPVRTDYACARQSLLNYLQNAVYHINGGNRIEVRLEDRGNTVRVRVRNSSAPIPEADAARLWEKLYRGDPSRQHQHGEMGLGLAIVKGNMERLGHAYGFENDPDFPGVCFWLELPKAEDPASSTEYTSPVQKNGNEMG